MHVYDFDDTIYKGDSTARFYVFCLLHRPAMLLALPRQGWAFLRWRTGRTDKTEFKEIFYSCFMHAGDVPDLVTRFWKKNKARIYPWYLAQQREDDVIISASPEFLLAPICRQLGIQHLIASQVEIPSGRYTGKNCYGEEKVPRFLEQFSREKITAFYSDSLSDTPMALLAPQAFLVTKGQLQPWPQE